MRLTDGIDMNVFGPTSRQLRALIPEHLRRLPAVVRPDRVPELDQFNARIP